MVCIDACVSHRHVYQSDTYDLSKVLVVRDASVLGGV